jgi:hypothetical protein
MNILKKYNKALEAIYDHVGFKEDWVIYPIDDRTEYIWDIDEENKEIHYADSKEEFENQDGNYYVDELNTQNFYSKWVYIGKKYTMCFADTRTDGMKYFAIFLNELRYKK